MRGEVDADDEVDEGNEAPKPELLILFVSNFVVDGVVLVVVGGPVVVVWFLGLSCSLKIRKC